MDRKQAYTIGAIAVVTIVALLMLVSAVSTNDDSFEGMAARGYDLANMPFATDAAEQYLLAAKYPDMRENGSTLLYSAAEKQARQEEDAQATEEEAVSADENMSEYEDNTSAARADNGGYSGYQGGGGRGHRGGGSTQVGQLSTAGMASAGGSGVSSTWGPTGDFRQFKGREDRGNEVPVQLKTGNARQALAQFRAGSSAAARIQQGKMTGARKALMGGNVAGSDAFGKDGVDLSKLQSGGLTLDTSAPPTSADLDNLDEKVAEAAKKAEEKKKEEVKLGFWEQLGQDLLRQAATSLVDSIMGGIGDTIRGTINGSRASSSAKKQMGNQLGSTRYDNLSAADKAYLDQKLGKDAKQMWDSMQGSKANRKYARNLPSANQAGADAWAEAREQASENYSQEQRAKARNTNVTTQRSTGTATR